MSLLMKNIYHSQSSQDEFMFNAFFKEYKKTGFFIELGALDGILISNSLFYERVLHWNGICIEPTPHYYRNLCKNRKSFNFNDVIYDTEKSLIFCDLPGPDSLNGILETYDQRHINRIRREILEHRQRGNQKKIKKYLRKSKKMDDILTLVGIKDIDFLSLDTEGSELNVLKSINWETTKIKVICVEDNYGDANLHDYIKNLGYVYYSRLEGDFIYYHPDLITPLI
jgi:FkbM family methyltransferase